MKFRYTQMLQTKGIAAIAEWFEFGFTHPLGNETPKTKKRDNLKRILYRDEPLRKITFGFLYP